MREEVSYVEVFWGLLPWEVKNLKANILFKGRLEGKVSREEASIFPAGLFVIANSILGNVVLASLSLFKTWGNFCSLFEDKHGMIIWNDADIAL